MHLRRPLAPPSVAAVKRYEPALLGFFFACWALTLLDFSGLVRLAGDLRLSFYALYSTAAATGWLFGNLYVWRSRGSGGELRRRLRLIYLLGPPGALYLLRGMAPAADQAAAPLIPLYAFGVYCVFFLVPIVLRRP